MLSAMNEFIHTKHVDPHRILPWITSTILHQIRKKVTARKRFLSRGTEYLKAKFNQLRIEIKKIIKESRKLFFSSLGNTLRINPKRFWSVFKINSNTGTTLSQSQGQIPTFRRLHYMQTRLAILQQCYEYFQSVYTNFSGQSSSPRPDSSPPLSSISSIDLSLEEVHLALQNLDPFKAHGPDGFPSRVLKECVFQLAPSLHYLFTKSLRLSQIPTERKLANIIPLHKKGVKEHVENYRPISLLSIVSKTLERCVLNYHSGRSSTSQLLSTLHKIWKDMHR